MTCDPSDPAARYRDLLGRLAAAAAARDAAVAEVECCYAASVSTADAHGAAADQALVAAAERVDAAAVTVAETDREASRIWAALRARSGWRAYRLGPVPAPGRATGTRGRPAPLLARAAGYVSHARPVPRVRLPEPHPPLLPLLGAAAAVVLALLAGGLAAADPAALRATGWLLYLAAPLTGIPLAARWAASRGRRFDVGGAGLVALGGMTAACAVAVLLT